MRCVTTALKIRRRVRNQRDDLQVDKTGLDHLFSPTHVRAGSAGITQGPVERALHSRRTLWSSHGVPPPPPRHPTIRHGILVFVVACRDELTSWYGRVQCWQSQRPRRRWLGRRKQPVRASLGRRRKGEPGIVYRRAAWNHEWKPRYIILSAAPHAGVVAVKRRPTLSTAPTRRLFSRKRHTQVRR